MTTDKIIFYIKIYHTPNSESIRFSDYYIEPFYNGDEIPQSSVSISKEGTYKGLPVYSFI